MLSRHPVEEAQGLNDDPLVPLAVLSIEDGRATLRAAQEAVPDWKVALEQLKLGKKTHPTYSLRDGLLYIWRPHVHGAEWKLCIPKKHRLEVLRACHGDLMAGDQFNLVKYRMSDVKVIPTSLSSES